MELCYTICSQRTFGKDHNGCIKPNRHNDAHVFKNDRGEYVEWEDNYDCPDLNTCSCPEEGDMCIVYSRIDFNPNR